MDSRGGGVRPRPGWRRQLGIDRGVMEAVWENRKGMDGSGRWRNLKM